MTSFFFPLLGMCRFSLPFRSSAPLPEVRFIQLCFNLRLFWFVCLYADCLYLKTAFKGTVNEDRRTSKWIPNEKPIRTNGQTNRRAHRQKDVVYWHGRRKRLIDILLTTQICAGFNIWLYCFNLLSPLYKTSRVT